MSVRTPSNTVGDIQARRLRQQVIQMVETKTGVRLLETMTLDQLVRAAAKEGVGIYMYSTAGISE